MFSGLHVSRFVAVTPAKGKLPAAPFATSHTIDYKRFMGAPAFHPLIHRELAHLI
jgi:hypothetical protein